MVADVALLATKSHGAPAAAGSSRNRTSTTPRIKSHLAIGTASSGCRSVLSCCNPRYAQKEFSNLTLRADKDRGQGRDRTYEYLATFVYEE
jgi:hypothetical protein